MSNAWDAYALSMHDHGACAAGVYKQNGEVWGTYAMEGTNQQEIANLVNNIKAGKPEMTLFGKKCIIMNTDQNKSMTGKSTGPIKAGEASPLWHVVLGASCVYMAACVGANERSVVEMLEEKFVKLKEY